LSSDSRSFFTATCDVREKVAWRVRKFFLAYKFMIGNGENSTKSLAEKDPLWPQSSKNEGEAE
jgi:hypothetical protein